MTGDARAGLLRPDLDAAGDPAVFGVAASEQLGRAGWHASPLGVNEP